MSTLYGYGDSTTEEVETIDSDEEDQKRSSRDPDKWVFVYHRLYKTYKKYLDYHFQSFGEMI